MDYSDLFIAWRVALRGLSWLVILLVAVGLIDGPLIHPGLPLGDDTELHLYRLVDLDLLIRRGIIFSRWQPDLVYGFGSPLFSFYAPLSAYLAVTGHLFGLSFRNGLRVAFAILPVVAGAGTLGFLRRRLGIGPSLLGALAYISSYYFLYNLFVRGSISDALAMALFPVTLLAFDLLVDHPGPLRAASASISLAALLLSHDISGPMFLPLLLLFVAWQCRARRASGAWAIAGVILGIGLTLFFYGPAATMVGDTRVPDFLGAPGMRFDQHFLSLGGLLVLAPTAYPGAMLTELPLSLGLVQTVFALVAIVGSWTLPGRRRGEVIVLSLILIGCAFLTVPLSNPIWEGLSVLRAVQYPWRFLALACFVDALLIGYAGEVISTKLGRRLGVAVLSASALVLLVLGIPYLYPLPGDSLLNNPTLADVTAYQQRSGALGVTSNSEFLPSGVVEFPVGPPFDGADRGASVAQKFDSTSAPDQAAFKVIESRALAAQIDVSSPSAFIARFRLFNFPGWSAWIDGQKVDVLSQTPYQTIGISVPSGRHILALEFTETPPELLFDLCSVLAAVAVAGLFAAEYRGRAAVSLEAPTWDFRQQAGAISVTTGGLRHPQSESGLRTTDSTAAALLGIGLLVIGLKWGLFDRVTTPLVRPFDGNTPPGMAVAAPHRFGPALQLIGYTWDYAPARPNEPLTLVLYWKTSSAMSVNYSSFVHVRDGHGQVIAQSDNVHVADFPTTHWRVNAYSRDAHTFRLPADVAPGPYSIDIGIYDRASGRQLPVDDQTTDVLALPPLVVEAANAVGR